MSSVDQKCCSEVLLRRVPQKCCQKRCSEVLLRTRTVDQSCRSGVSISSVEAAVLLKSVARKCLSEVLLTSVDQRC